MIIAQADIRNLPIPDNSVDLIFTDPPYLQECLPLYEALAVESVRVLKPGGFVLALCGGAYLNRCLSYFDTAGLSFYWLYQLEMTGQRTGIVWPRGNQQVHISTRVKHYAAYSKGESLSRTCTVGKFTDQGADKRYHAWGQNVASARYYIDCFSKPGDIVLDPFVGGGTTLIAAELIDRRVIGFDIDPDAVAISKKRITETKIPKVLPLFATEKS